MTDKPILIYVAKENCPACDKFTRDGNWERIMSTIGDGRATFVKFEIGPDRALPDVLTRRDYFFPMIILAAPNSYYRCFTRDDKINSSGWTNGYKIKGFRFNVVEDQDGKYTWAGRETNASGVIDWFNKVAPKIPSIDEPNGSPPDGLRASGRISYWEGPYQPSTSPTSSPRRVQFALPPPS